MWTYVGQVDLEQDAAGKWRARVALSDNGTTSTYVLKFQTQPASADIDAAAAGLVSNKNERAALLEMRVVVGSDGFPRALRYQTKEEFAARFRAHVPTGKPRKPSLSAFPSVRTLNPGASESSTGKRWSHWGC